MIEFNLAVWMPLLDDISPGWRERKSNASVSDETRAQLLKWAIADALADMGTDRKASAKRVLKSKKVATAYCEAVRKRYSALVDAAHCNNIRDKCRDQLTNDGGCYD